MKAMKLSPEMMMAGAALLAVAYFWMRGAKQAGQDIGEGISGAVVGTVDGVLSGTVKGVGEMVGVPKTNMTECERAKAEGRTWDASFACPAGDFIKYWWWNK